MLATCFSMDRLLASVTLRFFACKQNRIAVSPMWMEVGWEFGREVLFETMSRHSVLSPFSLSLFDVVHVFTSKQCILWIEMSIWFGLQESCSWVSSAKDWSEMECRRMSVVRGFVYKMNTIGPRTEPCGTPKLSKVGCENLLLMVTEFYWKGRIWTSWEVPLEKFHRGAQVFDRECCDLWCRTQPTDQEELRHPNTKSSNERLFILTRTHSMQIFGEIPSIKPQNDI